MKRYLWLTVLTWQEFIKEPPRALVEKRKRQVPDDVIAKMNVITNESFHNVWGISRVQNAGQCVLHDQSTLPDQSPVPDPPHRAMPLPVGYSLISLRFEKFPCT